jgi:ribonuclease BN (tRNA processing enzyme)
MEVTILGCRGSYPVAYPEIARYGGDTTCIRVDAGESLILLDAGTGIRKIHTLPDSLREVHVFITHLHWDHIIGFPDCTFLQNRPDVTMHLYGLERTHHNFDAALHQSFRQPLHEESIAELLGRFQYHELRPGEQVDVNGSVGVSCALANHPYKALGYRLEDSQHALTFIPDTAPFDRYLFDDEIVFRENSVSAAERAIMVKRQDQLTALAGDVDWLIYDAAMTPDEYKMLPHWGHSTMDQAAELATAASAKELILFHHAPTRSDEQIDALVMEQVAKHPHLSLAAAYAGMRLGVR